MRSRLAVLAAPVLAAPVLLAPLLLTAGGTDLTAGHQPSTFSSTSKAHTVTYAKPAGRRWN